MLLGLDIVVVVETVGGEHGLYLLVWTRGDLVDHRPGEGYLRLVFQVVEEGGFHKSVGHPFLRVGEDTCLHLVAVVRAVVHALHGKWQFPCFEAFKQEYCHLAHGEDGGEATLQVSRCHTVALLGDGEGNHLQRWIAEDFHQSLPVSKLVVGFQGFGYRGDDFLLDGAGRLQADQEREVAVGGVGLVDDLKVEGLCHDDATVVFPAVQRIVEDGSGESTEDVSASEVHPCRCVVGLLCHGGDVELGKFIAFGFPFSGIVVAGKYICQFHN